MTHSCDLCGSFDRQPLRQDPRIAICDRCGFVYVPERRASGEIARAWDDVWDRNYDPSVPGVQARLWYVARWLDLQGKTVLDIGAGRGTFLTFAKEFGAIRPCGIEASKIESEYARWNTESEVWTGDIDEIQPQMTGSFDVVTILWTLENCGDCMAFLRKAKTFLNPGGKLVVATGSRILVPFHKPLSSYLSPETDADLHCFRFSATTLERALNLAGMTKMAVNPFWQCEWLVMAAVEAPEAVPMKFGADDPDAVRRHFNEWERLFP